VDAYDDRTSDDTADQWPLRQGPPSFPLSALLLVPVAMLIVGGIGVLAVVQLQFVPARILLVGGLPYAVVALVVAAALRIVAGRRPVDERADDLLASGRSPGQRISFAVAVWLLVLWLGIAVVWAATSGPPLVVAGGPLIAGAVISIVANARLLYSPRVARAEVGAVRTRAPGRGWILANWVLAPVSWFAFAIPATVLSGAGLL
jgi:hypothetical protein